MKYMNKTLKCKSCNIGHLKFEAPSPFKENASIYSCCYCGALFEERELKDE